MEPRDIDRRLDKVEWRLDALDEWRRTVTTDMDRMEARIERLDRADEIANAVANKLGKRTWGYWQRGAVVIAAIAVIADVVLRYT